MDKIISLKFEGKDLDPSKIDFKKLSKLVEDYFRLLATIGEDYSGLVSDKSKRNYSYSLIKVESSSVDLELLDRSDIDYQEQNDRLTEAVSTRSTDQFSLHVRNIISDYSKSLATNDIPLVLKLFSKTGIVAVLDPKDHIIDSSVYKTSEEIYGQLTDVGGANPNVHLTSRFGAIKCDVTREQAIQLGSRLYTTVGLLCEVHRSYGSEKPERLIVTEILPYDKSKWYENIEVLQKAFSEKFMDLNVENYFRELRGGQ